MKNIVRLTESDLVNIIKKVIKEQESSPELTTLNSELSQAGIGEVTQEDVNELLSDCPIDAPTDSKSQDIISKIQQRADSVDINTLKDALKQIKSYQGNKIQEQIGALTILGFTIPAVMVTVLIGAIAIIILGSIAKRIFGKKNYDSRSRTHCGKLKKTLLPRIGLSLS